MKIQVGQVKYKGRDDYRVVYGTTDDGRLYYFLDDTVLENGGRIASTELVEAIDNSVKPSHVGVVNNDGKEIIPCNNKNVKLINNGILLVELSEPQSENVKNTIALRNDPTAAAKLVSTPATIKSKIGSVMSKEGRYVFNDLFSEAYICDLEANVLVDGLYSFVAVDPTNQKIYLSKNDVNDSVIEYSILPPQVQNDVTPGTDSNDIDVTEVDVPQDTVEDALNSSVTEESSSVIPTIPDVASPSEEENAENIQDDVATDNEAVGDVQGNSDEESNIENSGENDSLVTDTLSQDVADDSTKEEVAEVDTSEDKLTEDSADDVEIPDVDNASNSEDTVVDSEENNDNVEDSLIKNDDIDKNLEGVAENSDVSEEADDIQTEEFEFDQETKEDEKTVSSDNEKNTLEDMYNEPDSETDDIPNYSFDNFNEQDIDGMLDDDIFVGSEVKPDKIDTMDDFDINIGNSKPDNLMEDVAQSFKDLMKSNKEQRIVIAKYKERIKKLEMSLNMLNEKKKTQAEMLKELSNRYRKLENDYTRCNTRVQLLESKVEDQGRIISSQERELTSIRPQLAGKEELARLLTDAKALLNSDSTEDDYYYRQAA